MYELIEISGKQYPIRFGMNALRIFCKEANIGLNDFSKVTENLGLDEACLLIQSGLIDGARKAGQEFHLSVEDIADSLDEDFSIIEKAMEYLKESFDAMGSGNLKGGKAPKKEKTKK